MDSYVYYHLIEYAQPVPHPWQGGGGWKGEIFYVKSIGKW